MHSSSRLRARAPRSWSSTASARSPQVPRWSSSMTRCTRGALAQAHVARWRDGSADRRIVAITGSAGKTTTKQLCAALLAAVASDPRHGWQPEQPRRGCTAVAFGLEPAHRFAVFECGMSVRGEIAALRCDRAARRRRRSRTCRSRTPKGWAAHGRTSRERKPRSTRRSAPVTEYASSTQTTV